MVEYRTNKTKRVFYKIDGVKIIEVWLSHLVTMIKKNEAYPYGDLIAVDPDYPKCTEEEFKAAHSEALKIVNSDN